MKKIIHVEAIVTKKHDLDFTILELSSSAPDTAVGCLTVFGMETMIHPDLEPGPVLKLTSAPLLT
ncbi:hypothetical protein D3C78_1833090 [compost metagenome]